MSKYNYVISIILIVGGLLALIISDAFGMGLIIIGIVGIWSTMLCNRIDAVHKEVHNLSREILKLSQWDYKENEKQ